METVIKRFDQLTARELYEILSLRVAVFVVEQNCPYLETDGLDREALHVYLRDDEGKIVSYLRVMDRGAESEFISIGRVVSAVRRKGYATRLLGEAIAAGRKEFGDGPVYLEAQVYAKELYGKLGFEIISEPFLLDGIPHVKMLLK